MPDTIRNLKDLTFLYVHHNQIAYIPQWINTLSNIEILDISYNQLFEIPDLSVMPALNEIDIQSNQIAYFPWTLLEKPNLKFLIVKDNPFILSKQEVKQLEKLTEELQTRGVIVRN
ncbi:MAG: hypothetical protein KKB74_09410 [Bacteroidetes bacterium]|nr:hypothetical protein [Bacteroidota bacterium]